MANINLSQGASSERRGTSFFDKGFAISLVLLALTVGVYGGLKWYINSIDQRSAEMDRLIQEKNTELQSERVKHLADVDNRLTYLGENNLAVMPEEVLGALEATIIPQVSLNDLVYSAGSGTVKLSAATDSFKTLAQQLQNFKSQNKFSGVEVGEVRRDEDGRILFSLTATFSQDTNKN